MVSEKRDIRVIVAHELSPFAGSECSNGWNIISRLPPDKTFYVYHADFNQSRSRCYTADINRERIINKMNNIVFVPVSYPKWCQFLSKISYRLSNDKATGFKVVYFFVYRAWLNKVHHLIRNETENKDVKFIHLLNHISFREPGRFSELSIPFLWGPISGCSAIAPGFIASAPLRIKIQNRLRDFSNYIALRKKSVKLACSNASTIFVVTREDARLLPIYNLPVKILSDVGCKLSQTTSIRQRLSSDHDELRILWVGRLDYNKALHILLHSLQQVTTSSQRRVKLSVIGSGTEKAYLQGVSQSLSSFIRIDWFGEIPHDQVLAEMQTHHIFVHTSIKEAGCTVVMEALSSGLPVACHDAFGMASTVDESCGWKIPYKDPILSGNAFAAIIDEILDNPSLIELKSRMALLKRRSISWESIVNRITLAYKEQEARDLRG